jgi:hypothetical protein
MAALPPHSSPTAPEGQAQEPQAGVSDPSTPPRRGWRCSWVVALGLVTLTMVTFLVLPSEKMLASVFPSSAPDDMPRAGVSAMVRHEWQNARADHEAIAATVAQCLDTGVASGHPGVLQQHLRLDLEPNGERLRSPKLPDAAPAKALQLPGFHRATLYLSDAITRARMDLAGHISANEWLMRVFNIALVIIGALTTTFISVKATASGDQMKSRLYQLIGIAAIVLSALGTMASGLNAFYTPQEKYTRHQKALEMLKHLHVEVAATVSSQDLDLCRAKMTDDTRKKVKDWTTRFAGIWTAAETTVQGGHTPPRLPSPLEPDPAPRPGTDKDPVTTKPVSERGTGEVLSSHTP